LKYILPFILIILFTACSKNSNSEQTHTVNETNKTVTDINKTKKSDVTVIDFKNFKLEFKKNELIYPKEKTIILFENNNSYSKAQELVLKKLNVKYYKTDSVYLKEYFGIQTYPTIVVLENNKTVKYENFTPYEILKAEGF